MKLSEESVRVFCPRDRGKERTVYLKCADDFPIHCNGCEELSGSEVCDRCRAGAIIYYAGKPQARNEIIYPLNYIQDKQP